MVADYKNKLVLYAFAKSILVNDLVIWDVYTTWKDAATSSTKEVFDKHCVPSSTTTTSTPTPTSGFAYNCTCLQVANAKPSNYNNVKRAFINLYLPTTTIPVKSDQLASNVGLCAATVAKACKTHFTQLDISQCAYIVHSTTERWMCNALHIDVAEGMNVKYTPINADP